MDDLTQNIKKILFVFLLCFVALISYLTYFVMFQGPQIVNKPNNKRTWAKRNEVLRGTIYDRNMKALTKSEKIDVLKQKREYTGGEMFAHVLGYVNEKYGITGLEYKYDSELMAVKSQSLNTGFKKQAPDTNKVGNSLRITIDYDVQKAAFDLLGNNRGAVVALDPKSGEIIAMVSKPSFNPNNLEDTWKALNSDPKIPLLNRAVSGMYPPGSTFKTITAVSALENIQGIMSRSFQDTGKLVFNQNESLKNYNGEVLGNINFKDAYVESSNVFFGTLGMEIGNDKLRQTAEKFYFNKDIPADGITIDNSQFPKFSKSEKGNIAQSAIGQSKVLATPMEMALVAGTVANDGVMMKPMLVKDVLTPEGKKVSSISPSALTTVTSKENAAVLKDFMRGVVTSGTGTAAAVQGINVCGKTGTAEHDDVKNVDEPPHSWFIGFAPYENPTIALAVIVEDGGVGGGAAAKIASGVFKTYLKK